MSTSQIVFAVCFWTCFGAVFYVYLCYPILIWCLAGWFGRRVGSPQTISHEQLPSLTLLIAAHNEEAVIEDRLRNALTLEYPHDKLDIVIASDGSTDGTAEIVRRFAKQGVRLLDFKPQRGKTAVLNAAFMELTSDIVMLSDANTYIEPDAARNLVRWFQDSSVGVVCGRLILTDPRTGRNVDSLYWRYETFLKRCEGRLGALLGVNGAIYAIRRSNFTSIPIGTIVDDLVIPLQSSLITGCALIYDREAVAHEETAPNVRSEFHRRARIGTGGFQCISMLWRLLNPRRGWIAFTFLSHKVLRWLCPFAMLGMLLTNLLLLPIHMFQWIGAAQAAFYLIALAAAFVPGRSKPLRLLRLTTLFTSMNAALLVGFCRWIYGGQNGTWKRTIRQAEIDAVSRLEGSGSKTRQETSLLSPSS